MNTTIQKEIVEFNDIKKRIQSLINEKIKSSNLNKLTISIYLKLVNHVFKYLEEKHISNNKIFFDYQLWVTIHQHDLIRKNANLLHNLTKFLKYKRFLTSNSKLFPENQVLTSINKLSHAFLHTDFHNFDHIIDVRDNLIQKINSLDTFNEEKESLIYIYFRLFIVKRIPVSYYQYFIYENIFHINGKLLLVIKVENKKISNDKEMTFIPIKTILFSSEESKIINQFFIDEISLSKDLFSNDFTYYENQLKKFCSQNNLTIKKANKAVEFNYQHENTPLLLTLYNCYKYPSLSLFEVDKLFPSTIPNDLLEVEKENLNFYRNSPSNIDDIEIDLDERLASDYKIFDKFKTVKNVPKSKFVTKEYLNKWYHFIEKYRSHQIYGPMCNYVKYILSLSNRELNTKAITSKTLQSYLQRIFDYCFTIIVKSIDLEDALLKIDEKLKKNITSPEVLSKYEEAINKFLINEYNVKKEKINNTINYNRSIIFEDELKKVVKRLEYKDKGYKCEILKLRRQVFVILAYYSGLRKSELQTRLLKDFYYVGDKKFVIDVNAVGFRKSKLDTRLKNRNARRRVEIDITNSRLYNIVKKYYDLISDLKLNSLFPDILESTNTPAKKRVIKTIKIDEISSILQKVTKRYTVIHSLRHTYATNEIKRLINSNNTSISDIFDFLIKFGHADFETTLKRYIHIDLLYFEANKVGITT
ncbi:MAG: hypothetical protein CL624_11660 [Arcobacter sp.]|nr:hypothetical protein [Arcobacter sp.]|tara:strand:+ start:10735 stop:12837 length:2103 start_codon:yes stop_codon:yes gene_type:complete